MDQQAKRVSILPGVIDFNHHEESEVSQVALVVKNPPANAGDVRKAVSIPESGRSSGEGMAAHSSILAWRIPWTEEPGGLQSMGSKTVGHN